MIIGNHGDVTGAVLSELDQPAIRFKEIMGAAVRHLHNSCGGDSAEFQQACAYIATLGKLTTNLTTSCSDCRFARRVVTGVPAQRRQRPDRNDGESAGPSGE